MKWRKWLAKSGMKSLKLKTLFLEAEWKPQDGDRTAAWELYVELLTRVATQPLSNDHGSEQTALDSIYSLFPTTREVMKRNGPECGEFAKIAIPVLNQIVRPFTAKWHRLALEGAFSKDHRCEEFRAGLTILQGELRTYTKMLADMAGVEDLTELEDVE